MIKVKIRLAIGDGGNATDGPRFDHRLETAHFLIKAKIRLAIGDRGNATDSPRFDHRPETAHHGCRGFPICCYVEQKRC